MNRKNFKKDKQFNSMIDDRGTKQKLIDYIYTTIDLSDLKFKLVEVEDDLPNVKRDFYVSPNYNGTNCLLVFIKLAHNYYSFLVDRKTLSYNKNQVDINSLKITPVKIRLNFDIYNGTIMDGILLNTNDNTMSFVINDVYYFRGRTMMNTKMLYKQINLETYLSSTTVNDNIMNNIELHANKYYNISETKSLIETVIPGLFKSNEIKGVAFYPETTGLKYIYLFSNVSYSNTDKEETEHSDTNDVPDIDDGTTGVFEIRSTSIVDVYKLFLLVKIKKGGKNVIKTKKIGIASIPTQDCSKMCKKLVGDKKKALVKCKFVKDKNKWIPVEASTAKRPNYYHEIFGDDE